MFLIKAPHDLVEPQMASPAGPAACTRPHPTMPQVEHRSNAQNFPSMAICLGLKRIQRVQPVTGPQQRNLGLAPDRAPPLIITCVTRAMKVTHPVLRDPQEARRGELARQAQST